MRLSGVGSPSGHQCLEDVTRRGATVFSAVFFFHGAKKNSVPLLIRKTQRPRPAAQAFIASPMFDSCILMRMYVFETSKTDISVLLPDPLISTVRLVYGRLFWTRLAHYETKRRQSI